MATKMILRCDGTRQQVWQQEEKEEETTGTWDTPVFAVSIQDTLRYVHCCQWSESVGTVMSPYDCIVARVLAVKYPQYCWCVGREVAFGTHRETMQQVMMYFPPILTRCIALFDELAADLPHGRISKARFLGAFSSWHLWENGDVLPPVSPPERESACVRRRSRCARSVLS